MPGCSHELVHFLGAAYMRGKFKWELDIAAHKAGHAPLQHHSEVQATSHDRPMEQEDVFGPIEVGGPP